MWSDTHSHVLCVVCVLCGVYRTSIFDSKENACLACINNLIRYLIELLIIILDEMNWQKSEWANEQLIIKLTSTTIIQL